jgi:hypothetical protein
VATKSKKPTGEKHRADAVEMIQRIERVKQLASGHEQPTRAELAAEWGVTTRAVSSVIERRGAALSPAGGRAPRPTHTKPSRNCTRALLREALLGH